MPNSAPVHVEKRKRRWLIRITVGVILLAVLAFGIGVFVTFLADADLTDIYARLDREDPNWRLEDLEAHRKEVAAEENSALQVMGTYRAIAGPVIYWNRAYDKIFARRQPQARLNVQQTDYLQDRMRKLERPLLEARKLKDMPEGRFPLAYAVDYQSTRIFQSELRGSYELLQWDAVLRSDAGDADGGLESCRALLNAARSVSDEPFLVSQLVRYAGYSILVVDALEPVLALGQPSDTALKRIEDALAREIAEPTLRHGLRGARAGFHRLMTTVAEGKASLAGATAKTTKLNLLSILPGHLKSEHGRLLVLLTEMVDAASLPLHEQAAAFAALEARLLEKPSVPAQFVFAPSRIADAHRRTQAHLRCAMVAIAAERYRQRYEHWPKSLDDLVSANYLDAVPDDPFAAGRIKLKRRVDGITIYSVGFDGVDNDGNIDHDRSFRDPGLDLGFRLWNINARRQAPLPTVTLDAQDR
ncbi:MAG: hypothetical protein HY040_20355 [Planctomycetes bacterium]|nr:hypothetical protein [Planctomycetota bacterium]